MEGYAEIAKSGNSTLIGTELDRQLRRLTGLDHDPHRVNLGWRMILVADAWGCFDLPDRSGEISPAETWYAVHLPTLRAKSCEIVISHDLSA